MLLFLLAFYAEQYNSVRATLLGWRTTIRAEVVAEYNDSTTDDTVLPHYGVCVLCSAHVNGITNPAHYARNQSASSSLSKNEAMLTAED